MTIQIYRLHLKLRGPVGRLQTLTYVFKLREETGYFCRKTNNFQESKT